MGAIISQFPKMFVYTADVLVPVAVVCIITPAVAQVFGRIRNWLGILRREESAGLLFGKSEEQFRFILEEAAAKVLITRGFDHSLEYASPQVRESLGEVRLNFPIARALSSLASPQYLVQACDKAFNAGEQADAADLVFPRNSDNVQKTEINYYTFAIKPFFNKSKKVEGLVITIENTTANMKLRAQLQKVRQEARREREQAVLFDLVLSKAPVGFALLDKNFRFVRINELLAGIGGKLPEEYVGKSVRDLLPRMASVLEGILSEVLSTRQPVLNFELSGVVPSLGQTEKKRHWLASFYPVSVGKDEDPLGVGAVVYEVTAQKDAQQQVHYHAFHDTLTGLPNRKSFEEQLVKTIHLAKLAKSKFAVLFIDLDRLKDINDSLGHDFGDMVLKESASRLQAAVGDSGLVARWGGDEFVVLVYNVELTADAVKMADHLLEAMQPIMRVSNHSLHVTGSVGVALFPADGEDFHTLQKHADTALYRAKDAGKNRYELYTASMNVESIEKLALENDLRVALKNEEFDLYYQPVLDLKTNTVRSVETLLRWRHPKLGFLSPGKFVSLAEEIGVIVPLGKWVLATALEHTGVWHSGGHAVRLSVNMSARQFAEDNLVENILETLDQTGFPPGFLEIEITETIAMENLEHTKAKLYELKKHGISIVIDDFGTGYSSLNYLKRFPIDTLKIDQSFVRHILTDEQDTSIIKAIISMAQSLQLKVIAEGVNTEMQLNLLRSLGCDAVQGYCISRALNRFELLGFLRKDGDANLLKTN